MSHRVSVIVPVWNMARFLPNAIASIPDVHEIIIVAAESDDDTVGVAHQLAERRLGVRVLSIPKKPRQAQETLVCVQPAATSLHSTMQMTFGRKAGSLCSSNGSIGSHEPTW